MARLLLVLIALIAQAAPANALTQSFRVSAVVAPSCVVVARGAGFDVRCNDVSSAEAEQARASMLQPTMVQSERENVVQVTLIY